MPISKRNQPITPIVTNKFESKVWEQEQCEVREREQLGS